MSSGQFLDVVAFSGVLGSAPGGLYILLKTNQSRLQSDDYALMTAAVICHCVYWGDADAIPEKRANGPFSSSWVTK